MPTANSIKAPRRASAVHSEFGSQIQPLAASKSLPHTSSASGQVNRGSRRSRHRKCSHPGESAASTPLRRQSRSRSPTRRRFQLPTWSRNSEREQALSPRSNPVVSVSVPSVPSVPVKAGLDPSGDASGPKAIWPGAPKRWSVLPATVPLTARAIARYYVGDGAGESHRRARPR
jgi:hypothetical protein